MPITFCNIWFPIKIIDSEFPAGLNPSNPEITEFCHICRPSKEPAFGIGETTFFEAMENGTPIYRTRSGRRIVPPPMLGEYEVLGMHTVPPPNVPGQIDNGSLPGVSMDEGMDDLMTPPSNISRMRKRFHDLLDDTFSLFGSRRDSPNGSEKTQPPKHIEVKSHSAISSRQPDTTASTHRPRPKTTTNASRHAPEPGDPRKAWPSSAPSPLVRPLSAGVLAPTKSQSGITTRPRVNVDHVLAEGKFKENDPAISLIQAIKTEIERVSLPGSTADLRE